MKRFAFVFAWVSVLAVGASAQTMPTTISADSSGVQLSGPNEGIADTPEKKKVYDKRVGGKVWLEATAGPSRYDATRFRSLDIVPAEARALIPRVVVSGPEFGAALRFRAGSSTIGARFKRADYEPFDLTQVGLDLGVVGLLAVGETVVIVAGMLDISVGSIASVASPNGISTLPRPALRVSARTAETLRPNAAGAAANRVALEASVKARNQGREIEKEARDILTEAARNSPELAIAMDGTTLYLSPGTPIFADSETYVVTR